MDVPAPQPAPAPRRTDPWRAGFALALAVWLSVYFRRTDHFGLLDHVDLAVHEAGHVLFASFGEFMGMAGGTLLQLIVPLAFVAYFGLRRDPYAAAIVAFWFAQSLCNVATYMADARAQRLPLVGGEYVLHDWHWMLSRVGLIRHDTVLAGGVRAFAAVVLLAALAVALRASLRPAAEPGGAALEQRLAARLAAGTTADPGPTDRADRPGR
jgi:hypothetical protein